MLLEARTSVTRRHAAPTPRPLARRLLFLYPRGDDEDKSTHLSIYLSCEEADDEKYKLLHSCDCTMVVRAALGARDDHSSCASSRAAATVKLTPAPHAVEGFKFMPTDPNWCAP